MPDVPVDILIRIPNAAALGAVFRQLNQSGAQFNATINQVNNSMGRMNGTIMRGIGSFYVMRRAMEASFGALKMGVQQATDMDFALKRLQLAVRGTTTDMGTLLRIAVNTAQQLGNINATDIIAGTEVLSRTTGMGLGQLANMIPMLSTAVNNIMLLSRDRVDSGGAFRMIQQVISATGGAGDPRQMEASVRATLAAIQAFGAEDPEGMVRSIVGSAPLLRMLRVPFGTDVLPLIALRQMLPVGGARGRGKEIADFVSVLEGGPTQHGKAGARQQAAMATLGLFAGGAPVAGAAGISEAIIRMAQHVEQMRASMTPAEFNRQIIPLFKAAFPGIQGQRFAEITADNWRTLSEIRSRIAGQGSMEATAAALLGTPRGAFQQFRQDINTLLGLIYQRPVRGLGAAAQVGTRGLAAVTTEVMNSPAFSTALVAAAAALPMALMARIAGAFMSGFGMTVLGGAATGAGVALAGVAVTAGATVAAVETYRHSDRFALIVEAMEDLIDGVLEGGTQLAKNVGPSEHTKRTLMETLRGWWDSAVRGLTQADPDAPAGAGGGAFVGTTRVFPRRGPMQAPFSEMSPDPIMGWRPSDSPATAGLPTSRVPHGVRTAITKQKLVEGIIEEAMKHLAHEQSLAPRTAPAGATRPLHTIPMVPNG